MGRGGFSVALLLAGLFVFGVSTAAAGASAPTRMANVERLAPPTAFLVPTRAASGNASFADPTADSGAAPDVTSVTVSNDDQGLITFRIAIANRSALGTDDVIAIAIGTNDPDFLRGWRDDGMNFILLLEAEGAFLLEWNGQAMTDVEPKPGSVAGSFLGGTATLTVRQEDLAPGFPDLSVPIELDFYVLGIAFSGNNIAAQDDAPDGTSAAWKYRLSEALRLIVTSFDPDRTVKPGKSLVVLLGLAHGDTGAAVTSGKIVCKARLGNKALKGKPLFFTITLVSPTTGQTLRSPVASCTWAVPKKKSKGKTIRGSVAVTKSGITVNRPFSTRVR